MLKTVWYLIIMWNLLAAQQTLAYTDHDEVISLEEMYVHLKNPSELNSWKGKDPCEDLWKGIICIGSSITELNLSGLNLSGNLSFQLEKLKGLKKLDLSKNIIEGEMPAKLPEHIKHVNLSHNKLSGKIKDYCQELLEKMDLSFNQLTGDIMDIPCIMMIKEVNLKGNLLTYNTFKNTISTTQKVSTRKRTLMENQPPKVGMGRGSFIWVILSFTCFGVLAACKADYKYKERMLAFVNEDGRVEYPCNGCIQSFESPGALLSHLTSHKELKLACPKKLCPCKFKNKADLGLHFAKKHPGEKLR